MEHDKHNEPDKRIREKLNSYELQPDANLWKDIEHELDKSKRRSIFYRKRYLLLLLLLISGSTLYLLLRNGTSTSDNTGTYTNDNKSIQQEIIKSETQSSTENSNQNITDNTNNTNSIKSNTDNNSTPKGIPMGQVVTNAESKETSSTQTDKNLVTKSNGLVESKNESSQITALQQNNDQIITNGTTVQQEVKTEIEISASENNIDTSVNSTESVLKTDEEIALEKVINDAADSMIAEINNEVSINEVAKNDSIITTQQAPTLIDTTLVKPLLPKKSIQWYAGVYTQLNSVSKTINTTNSRPEYLQRRRDEEIKTNTLSYGLKVGVDINRFNIQSCIGIRTYADNIQYENRQLCYDLRHSSSVASVYDTVGAHPGVSSVIGKSNGKAANRYVELPLMVGYRVGGKLFFVKPMIGIAMALPLSWTSQYIDASVSKLQNPKDINQLKPIVFNLLGELTVSASLSKNIFVDIGLNYHRNLSTIIKQEAGFSQRYSGYGGILGLTYHF